MARNKLPGIEQAPAESGIAREAGGGSGVRIPDTEIVTPRALSGVPARPAKRYRVLNGGQVLYNNCRTAIRAGKEITDTQFDIELLRRQGIRLEEIVEAPAPQQAVG